jgi:hypothetical protein
MKVRMIDANALMRRLSISDNGDAYPEYDCDGFPVQMPIADFKRMVREAPAIAVDNIDIVHCQDCMYRTFTKDKYPTMICGIHSKAMHRVDVFDDYYCSWGVRRGI